MTGACNLHKILEGPSDGLFDMAVHPHRPQIATVTHFGEICMWNVTYNI